MSHTQRFNLSLLLFVLTAWGVYSGICMFYFHPKEIDLALRTAANAAQIACVKDRIADNKRFREALEKIMNPKSTKEQL